MNATTLARIRQALIVAVFGAATLALTAGCSLTRQAPVKETYLLQPVMPGPVATAQKGTLRVGGITVAAPFRGRSFVVRASDERYDADFYREFLVAPAANIADVTARAMAVAKVFENVVPPGVAADGNWVLDGFVAALYGDARDEARPVAVLEITYFVSRSAGGVPVWTRTYQRRETLAVTGAGTYVAAQNAALASILAELARDLAAAKL